MNRTVRDVLDTSIPRPALNRCLGKLTAWWPTRTSPSLTLLSSSPLTSSYCLSCSLACSACASINPARPVWDASCGDRWAIDDSPWLWFSLSADVAAHSQGSDLALGCHHSRHPTRGK